MNIATLKNDIQESIKSLGIVFGDIGTSPIYTFSAIFALMPATLDNIMGISSLIIWTLMLLVTGQYAWLAMSLAQEHHGEGGIIVLRQILVPLLSSRHLIGVVTFLSFVGTAFFIGDGVITPAISILSAVEGLSYIPNFKALDQTTIVLLAALIACLLFACQRRGTERLSKAFGPIMCIWFIFLALSGIIAVIKFPAVLLAISPSYALHFMFTNGFVAFLLLSKVILCATGSEPLYTDMGHLGRKPIIQAWFFVFPALCLIYLGQGAFLLENPQTENVFYGMISYQFPNFYIPILLLSIVATVIASQAMITGLFSIVYQAMTTHIMPKFRVEYTSSTLMSQIFIPSINNFLAVFVILTIFKFKSSQDLTVAYGIAVSGTMTITSILLTAIFSLKRFFIKAMASFMLIFVNVLFLVSNLFKIPYGGYWSLLVAFLPLTLIIIYTMGQRKLYKTLKSIPMPAFLEKFTLLSEKFPHINGTALFLSNKLDQIPAYVATTMFANNIMYEDNYLVKVQTIKQAFGVTTHFQKDVPEGLKILVIKVGYLEVVNIEKILASLDIYPKVIFFGVEDLRSKNLFWKVYIIIKKLTSSFVQFYKFPVSKLHGVQVQVD
ncbi:MAG TPA: KUP/HAK/KT family potassium transporter, partial [Candidatus Limnocylindria bacterium]|nr:KUP/HAK/KT family potassium transporter [Candidatus Limnocylindria bacterium]